MNRQHRPTALADAAEKEDTSAAVSKSQQQKGGDNNAVNENKAGENLPADSDVDYLQNHKVHLLLDNMVRAMLAEKPKDPSNWMIRWFLEQHRLQCEERYRENSPQHRPKHTDSSYDVSALSEETMLPPPSAIPLSFDE